MKDYETLDEGLLQPKLDQRERFRQKNRTAFWIVLCSFMIFSFIGNLVGSSLNYIAVLLCISPFLFLITIGIMRLKSWVILGLIYCICLTALFTFSLVAIIYVQAKNSSLIDAITPTIIGMGVFLVPLVWGIFAHRKIQLK